MGAGIRPSMISWSIGSRMENRWVWGVGSKVWCLGFRAEGLGFRVEGLWLRV